MATPIKSIPRLCICILRRFLVSISFLVVGVFFFFSYVKVKCFTTRVHLLDAMGWANNEILRQVFRAAANVCIRLYNHVIYPRLRRRRLLYICLYIDFIVGKIETCCFRLTHLVT